MNMYDKISVISVLGCAFILGTSLAIPHAAKAEINRTDVYELKRPIILTKENQGEQIHVPAGQFVSVHLAENPTTGYRWTMIDNNAGMPVLAEHFYSSQTTDGPVGKPGIHTFQFKATTPGIVKLQFKQWREWEGDSSVLDTFYVWLHIDK